MEKITRDNFDYLGIVRLKDAKGIEEFVTPLGDGSFLSRNAAYYSDKTCKQAVRERERCNELLPCAGRKAFVLAERMLNVSCRIYYAEFQKSLKHSETKEYVASRKCLEEDCKRVIDAVNNLPIGRSDLFLQGSDEMTAGRQMEADHKMILIESISGLKGIPFIVSTMYGATLIGPFFKAIHGTDYAHALFGMHDQKSQELLINGKIDLQKVMTYVDLVGLPKDLAIFEDNLGTGDTIGILKDAFLRSGKGVFTGAIEMSWDYYDQVMRGVRKEKLFSPESIDYPTYRSTRHHTLSDELISEFKHSGDDYLTCLKRNGFQNGFIPDADLLLNRGRTICEEYSLPVNSYATAFSNLVLSVDIKKRENSLFGTYAIRVSNKNGTRFS